MQKLTLKNLDCANCALRLENAIRELPGVDHVNIDLGTTNLYLDADNLQAVVETIKRIEPEIEVVDPRDSREEPQVGKEWNGIFPLLVAGLLYIFGLLLIGWLRSTPGGVGEYLVFGAAYAISGWPVLRNAARNIFRGRVFDENFLMSVATIGAIAIGEMPEAAGVMIFYMAGEALQGRSVRRSRQSIKALLETRPDRANLLRDGKMTQVHPSQVEVGEKFIVKPGEKIPLDGEIVQGDSLVDFSPLTGESRPKSVRPGDHLFAGSINKEGLLTLVAKRPYEDSSISRIVELAENAVSRKAQTERFITRFARIYSPAVVLGAIGVAVIPPLILGASFQEWIYRALVVLVISCPCALVISIPLGYFGGIGGASRRGILVKGSNFLDVLGSVRTLVFDKTGTLTRGIFKVTTIQARHGFSSDDLLSLAARAEAGSNHPIAQSLREANRLVGRDPSEYPLDRSTEIAGLGMKAVVEGKQVIVGSDPFLHNQAISHGSEVCEIGGTTVHVAVDGTYAGYLEIADELKDEAREAIQKLRSNGISKMVMLTGDHPEVAAKIAGSLGFDSFEAGLLPEGKLAALEAIIAQENRPGRVGFVGDGINDAPSLARADVGIAMGGLGSAAAIEAADVVIMTDSPGKIVEAVQIGRKTRAVVWQNILFALVVKGAFIALGITGEATMWQAVFGDMGVALLAILNASRVYRINP
jgi:Cd2+/Zn2+-exporting ATPase